MALFRKEIRIALLGLFVLLVGAGLLTRLWWVQVVRSDMYTQRIKGESNVTVRIPSVRGEIRDRTGVTLAGNRASYQLEFYLPEMVDGYRRTVGTKFMPTIPIQHTVRGLRKDAKEVDVVRIVNDVVQNRLVQLGVQQDYNADKLQRHYRNNTQVPFTFIEDLKFAEMARLSERSLGLPGVSVSPRPVRQYPYGALAAHVLGYVGAEDTDAEEAKRFNFYQADVTGKSNIELTMDKYLRGKPGVRVLRRDVKGVVEGEASYTPPTPGSDVYLTIDARIQTIVEQALRAVGRGAAVVVDPTTGNILAMASVPSFDPNVFIPSIPTADWNALIKDDTNPLINRAISSYAPGSTYKPITALAGLKKGIGNRTYNCSGGVQYGDKFMKCHIFGRGVHGTLKLEDALKFSCNSFFFQYGNEAGIDQIESAAHLLGLGQRTGIELTNEASGQQPGRDWLVARTPRARWSDGQTANTSIGQGYVEATPLQMALVAATLANGGTCFYPRLIDKVADKDGNIEMQDPPRVRTNLLEEGWTAAQIEMVRKGMWKVVNDSGGTAQRARLKGVAVAGKTGTAEFYRNGVKDNHTWFISFAPYERPRYAIAVIVQGAKSGGGVSAPISARIMEECLALDDGADVKLAALAPAPGSFQFVSEVDFSKSTPAITRPGESTTPESDEADDDDEEDNQAQAARGRERDSEQRELRRAEPVLRPEADARGRVAVRRAEPVNREDSPAREEAQIPVRRAEAVRPGDRESVRQAERVEPMPAPTPKQGVLRRLFGGRKPTDPSPTPIPRAERP